MKFRPIRDRDQDKNQQPPLGNQIVNSEKVFQEETLLLAVIDVRVRKFPAVMVVFEKNLHDRLTEGGEADLEQFDGL